MSSRKTPVTPWVSELTQFSRTVGSPNEFLTVREISERTGRSIYAIRQLLNQAKKMGMLEIGRKLTQQLNGVIMPQVAYRLKTPKPTKGLQQAIEG